MIRKLRLKFVAVCMAMVTAVLAVVCFAIFAALRGNVEDLSREVLHRVIQEDPGGRRPEIGVEIGGDKVLLPYFTVSVWPGGGGAYTAYVTGGTYAALEDTAELTAILEDCLGQEPPEGVIQSYSLRYLRRDNGLYQRMAFVDMSMERAMLRGLICASPWRPSCCCWESRRSWPGGRRGRWSGPGGSSASSSPTPPTS